MLIPLRVAAVVLGLAIVVSVILSALRTVVVPRSQSQRLTRFVFLGWRRVFDAITPASASSEVVDSRFSLYAPLSFVTLPVVWMLCSTFGFGLAHWGLHGGSAREAFLVSSSSILTLGVVFRRDLPSASLSFLEATIGLGLVALLISYLPTIYGAYAQREALVGMLESRAGMPPSPQQLLTRFERIGALGRLDEDLFSRWEVWFAELEESHTSFPGLAFFRSPHPERSWVTAAGTVLDTASLRLSVLDMPFSADAALCLRHGFLALRRICGYFGIETPADPQASDPITLDRSDFDAVVVALRAEGLPVVTDLDRAWADFRGWRVNYDRSLVGLAGLVRTPPGVWASTPPVTVRLRLLRR